MFMACDGGARARDDEVGAMARDAVAAVRGERWRDHALRSAERAVADQWLGHLRDRLRTGFTGWQEVRKERDLARRLLGEAEAEGDDARTASLLPWVRRATDAEWAERRHYREIADAVVAEACRVRAAIVEMNREHLAEMEEARTALERAVDRALNLPTDETP
ncbi:hypothetical protein [Actinomadura fibrosa]|uniref:Uncharacterized protein n=1 Tax=Actinomadura fibrosa TaxID=111802 RepID=A0ABW2XWV7_9ACTN|nr:hypothetical protein [Actinomadura fibrosa]